MADMTEKTSKAGTIHARPEVSDEMIEYVGILAKLELSGAEKEEAKKDMERMLAYIDKLNELDTEGVEPMTHRFPLTNVFREDIPGEESLPHSGLAERELINRESILKNAPEQKNGAFKAPKTVE